MSSASILQEYLVALGFKVDEASAKKAGGALSKVDVSAKTVAKSVLGASAAVSAFVTVYAYQMEKLYYASKRTGSSVGNIQALDYSFRQAGGSGEAIKSSLESVARSLRGNPGLMGLIQQLGVKVTGRDTSDVMMDLVTNLKAMPFYVAKQYASIFGIDEDTLFQMMQGLDTMKEAGALRKQMAQDAGVDLDAAAESGKKYATVTRELYERMGLLKDMVGIAMLPAFLEFGEQLNRVLSDMTRLVGQSKTLGDFWTKMKEWSLTGNPNGGVKLTAESRERLDKMGEKEPEAGTWWGRLWQKTDRAERKNAERRRNYDQVGTDQVRIRGESRAYPMAKQEAAGAQSAPTKGEGSAAEMFQRLEAKYALPKGLLDRIWHQESNRGDPRWMESSAGAKGHFQFMDPTAKQYGVDDPYDLKQSAQGAAQMMADLLRKYEGDLMKATAAYNWGQGNLDNHLLGKKRMPTETKKYMAEVAAPIINQTNNVTINGAGDAEKTARLQQGAMDGANATLVRDFKQRVY